MVMCFLFSLEFTLKTSYSNQTKISSEKSFFVCSIIRTSVLFTIVFIIVYVNFFLDPKWASINLGIAFCIVCSGIHRYQCATFFIIVHCIKLFFGQGPFVEETAQVRYPKPKGDNLK